MIDTRKLTAVTIAGGGLLAALALAAPADAGSTWAVVHGVTYNVTAVTVHGDTTTWAMKKGVAPATTTWAHPSPSEVRLGVTKVSANSLRMPTSIKLG